MSVVLRSFVLRNVFCWWQNRNLVLRSRCNIQSVWDPEFTGIFPEGVFSPVVFWVEEHPKILNKMWKVVASSIGSSSYSREFPLLFVTSLSISCQFLVTQFAGCVFGVCKLSSCDIVFICNEKELTFVLSCSCSVVFVFRARGSTFPD